VPAPKPPSLSQISKSKKHAEERKAKWLKMLARLEKLGPGDLADICCRWKVSEQSSSHHSLGLRTFKSAVGLSNEKELLGVKMTKKIRKGVPAEMREQVWWLCSGASEKMRLCTERGEKTYPELMLEIAAAGVDEAGLAKLPIALEVEKDLHRTFPNNKHFENEEGIATLRSILCAYGLRNPAVGYCQSMNFLAAFLLLNMEEDRAFWVLAAIIEDILPPGYYSKHMIGSRTDQRVLLGCLKWKLPALHKHFVNIGVAPENGEEVPLLEPLTCTWYLCIFINSLPLASSLRVWDCFMHEGRKVLLRVGLSVLKNCQPELMQCEDLCGVYEVLRNNKCVVSSSQFASGVAHTMMSADDLVDCSYDKSWIGGFPHDRIEAMRAQHKAVVEREAAEMEEKRKVRDAERQKREAEREAAREAEEREEQEREKEGEEDVEEESSMLRMAAMSVVSVDGKELEEGVADDGGEERGKAEEGTEAQEDEEAEEPTFKYSGKRNSLFLMVNSASNEQGPAALAAAALAGQPKTPDDLRASDVIKEEYFAGDATQLEDEEASSSAAD
jgi:hypothetical protein